MVYRQWRSIGRKLEAFGRSFALVRHLVSQTPWTDNLPDDLHGLSACVLVDGHSIAAWQAAALERAVSCGLRIACVYMCDNSHVRRKSYKHLGYYLLRMTCMRSSWTRPVLWRPIVGPDAAVRTFRSEWQGIWQRVPAPICREMVDFGFDVVIKFGMNLHRDPDDLPARLGVLSFHHGDPSEYRGRPAGFYEVLNGADHVGTIVQRIGNKLDAGKVFAYSASKVVPYSYRQTLETLFANSQHLLVKALRNLRDDDALNHSVAGKNYSLPVNSTVVKFLGLMAVRRIKRAGYGALVEKQWRVGRTNVIHPARTKSVEYLREPVDLMLPKGFVFTADPCPGGGGTIWCEALESRSGKGRLLVFRPDSPPITIEVPGVQGRHCSYPFIVESQGSRYLVPEMASVGPPRLFELNGTTIVRSQNIRGLEAFRIIDPTLLFHAGRWWLFGGLPTTATDLLWLWSATDVTGPYQPHPDNPVVMDVARARSAGPIVVDDGRLYRPGQDNRGSYGNGVTFSEIIELSTRRYREVPRGLVRVTGRKGPHTLFLDGDSTVVDSYNERLSVLAGFTRLKNKVPFLETKRTNGDTTIEEVDTSGVVEKERRPKKAIHFGTFGSSPSRISGVERRAPRVGWRRHRIWLTRRSARRCSE
jgi:hypothetical protein